MDDKDLTEKSNLDKEKLKLEIKELKKRWFQKPPYLSILLTLLIALVTIYGTLRSGIIDIEKKTLELKKAILEKDIKDFEERKGLLRDSISVFRDSVSELKRKEIEYIKTYNEYKTKEKIYIQKLRDENKKDEIIEYYKNRLDSLVKRRIFDETFDKTF